MRRFDIRDPLPESTPSQNRRERILAAHCNSAHMNPAYARQQGCPDSVKANSHAKWREIASFDIAAVTHWRSVDATAVKPGALASGRIRVKIIATMPTDVGTMNRNQHRGGVRFLYSYLLFGMIHPTLIASKKCPRLRKALYWNRSTA